VNGPAVPPPTDENTVVNPDLETMQNGFPACWYRAPWGDNDATFSLVSPGHSGSVASQVTITSYTSGEGKIIPTLDLGSCAPSVATGHSYVLSGWYTSTSVTQFAVYLRTTTGSWIYWTSSPWFAAASEWTQAVWQTDAIPPGYTGISFGLNIFAPGTLVTDDYSMVDAAPPVAESVAEPLAAPAAETPVTELVPADPPAESVEEAPAAEAPAEAAPPAGSTTPPAADPAPPAEEAAPPAES